MLLYKGDIIEAGDVLFTNMFAFEMSGLASNALDGNLYGVVAVHEELV